jgi:predicted Fe-S protein YdhL (DUF1289 family)
VTAAVTADPEGDAISELARFWNGLTADEQTAVWPQLSAESKQLIERARERDADTHADSFFPEARDKQQIPDGDLWLILLIMAGRGFGKTRTGAEWIVEESIERVGQYAIVAPTFSAGRCPVGPRATRLDARLIDARHRNPGRSDLHVEPVDGRTASLDRFVDQGPVGRTP